MNPMLKAAAQALCLHNEAGCWETHVDEARRTVAALRNPDLNTVLRISRETGLQCSVIDICWTAMLDRVME